MPRLVSTVISFQAISQPYHAFLLCAHNIWRRKTICVNDSFYRFSRMISHTPPTLSAYAARQTLWATGILHFYSMDTVFSWDTVFALLLSDDIRTFLIYWTNSLKILTVCVKPSSTENVSL